MLTLSSVANPNSDVVGTILDNGETVLMHMGTASYFTLNSTGTHIWTLLGQGLPLQAICDQLVATYEVSAEQAAQSVCTLVEQLVAQQLLTVVETTM